ncbi:MAG: hypothetical protein EON58_16110 [Alphaproteobacteria bacterium]|nr:MAG: hypothetical protein EON58_16110 [Alphaproteobacteria bacterium]
MTLVATAMALTGCQTVNLTDPKSLQDGSSHVAPNPIPSGVSLPTLHAEYWQIEDALRRTIHPAKYADLLIRSNELETRYGSWLEGDASFYRAYLSSPIPGVGVTITASDELRNYWGCSESQLAEFRRYVESLA